MAQATPEVSEAEAQGKIKDTYEDIKKTLRVPFVGSMFRVLAVYPDYLLLAWHALKPNMQTLYFERSVDSLRSAATAAVSSWNATLWPPKEGQTKQVVRVLHYATAKQFLAEEALRCASSGQHPVLAQLPAEEKRQIALGVPEQVADIQWAETDGPDDRAQAVFVDMAQCLGPRSVDGDYHVLAQWPDYLLSSWQVWRPMLGRSEFRQLERRLRWLSEEAISMLPFRMEIYPHALRHAGLSESEIDGVRAALAAYSRALPGLVGYSAFLSIAADGKERALQSPFPPSVL